MDQIHENLSYGTRFRVLGLRKELTREKSVKRLGFKQNLSHSRKWYKLVKYLRFYRGNGIWGRNLLRKRVCLKFATHDDVRCLFVDYFNTYAWWALLIWPTYIQIISCFSHLEFAMKGKYLKWEKQFDSVVCH